jgi:RNA polymerase sigma factor (sigma-70 family)
MSTSTLAAVVCHLRNKLARQCRHEESDEQLLHAFTRSRDESAFAVLVRRHGPMVLRVCRRVLGHVQDAEDAFQATFLVLALNAATLRIKTTLAGFLHGTAYRTAMKAKRSAVRRRKYEGQAPSRSPTDPADELSWREARVLLDEEIARLPEIYKSVFVLCNLEYLSQAEVSRRLGLKERTVSNRLAVARKRLAQRLVRRGVELTVVLAAATLAMELPAGLMAKTVEASSAASMGRKVAGVVSASVAELVEGTTSAVVVSKVKIATVMVLVVSLLSGASMCFLASPQRPQGQPLRTLRADEQITRAPRSAKRETAKTVEIRGRVLDPDGKPVVDARVYVDLQMPDEKPSGEGEKLWTDVSVDRQAPDEKPKDSTTTGKDGRFSLTLSRSRLVDPETKFPLQRIRILTTAKGYGLDWRDVPLDDAGKELTLRLVKDDVPIEGRILSLEGKPLAGIKVRIKAIRAFPRGDLSRALQAQRDGNQIVNSTEVHMLWYLHHMPDPSLMATTGADGRFRLEGIGRERIVTLNVEGAGIHYSSFNVMTRRGETVRNPYKTSEIYGATFDYLAKPSRLIRGTVREKGTGKPLAGIRIHDMGFTAYVPAEAVTDEQGHYELPGCPIGDRYGVLARPSPGAPFFCSSIVVKDMPGLGPLNADLEMVRGIPCEGKVLDEETGQAVPGQVLYSPIVPNPYVPEDQGVGRATVAPVSAAAVQADGTFRCVVLPGCGCLAFRAKEPTRYQQACVDPSTIKADGSKHLLFIQRNAAGGGFLVQENCQAIRLISPSKETQKVSEILRVAVARPILGLVLDAEGEPLTGVRVRGLERGEGWKTLPNEKFTVRCVNPLRPRQLSFIHETRRLIATLEVKGTETTPLTLRMQPWAAVHGRLVDAEGSPVRNAKVRGNAVLPEDCRTDEQGRFRLEGLIPGVRYDLTYGKDKPSMSGVVLKGFVGKPGEVRDLGDVRGQPFRRE